MPVPKFPSQLSSTSWAIAKGTSKVTTGVGPQLKANEARYKAIKWSLFDAKKLMTPGKPADQLLAAANAAEMEYTTKVKVLANMVGKTATLAKAAQNKLTQAKAPAKLIAHSKAVEDAALDYAAALNTLKLEVAQMKKFAGTPVVESIIGAAWFDRLESITVHNNSALAKWISSPQLAISPADDQPSDELADVQQRFAQELGIFKAALAKLKPMRRSRMEVKAAKKLLIGYWRHAADAYLAMKPGMQGLQREWGVTFTRLAGGAERANAWKRKYKAADTLNSQVERLMFDAEPAINECDERIDELSRG